MAPRTNNTEVKAILSTSLVDATIDAFIADASLWVTEELATLGTLSADRLKAIEKYLACAFCRLRDLGLTSATLEDVSESYQVDKSVTDYLLRAAGLDPTGTVRNHFLPKGDRIPVKFAVGTTFTEERKSAEDDE
jgi:cytochrome c551/c552